MSKVYKIFDIVENDLNHTLLIPIDTLWIVENCTINHIYDKLYKYK